MLCCVLPYFLYLNSFEVSRYLLFGDFRAQIFSKRTPVLRELLAMQIYVHLKRKRGGLIFQSRDYAVVKRRAAEAVWVAESLPLLRLILN